MAPLLALLFLFLSGARRCSAAATASPSSPPPPPAAHAAGPALFVIGDSRRTSAPTTTSARSRPRDREPYGRDFDTHPPHGAFSNGGRSTVDYLRNACVRTRHPAAYAAGRRDTVRAAIAGSREAAAANLFQRCAYSLGVQPAPCQYNETGN
ncbi:hypothetical protein HU200_050905 [Digitaria exilis]|uniref:Uncharacterized protein n=1 Tax=Digitaria exilis TaxID=1010633 RepID=A0A835E8N0_9POAL|nr:hypothetical protein HU200_050905 [Digitaria exilis]